MCEISRWLDNAFVFYSNLCEVCNKMKKKRGKKKNKQKNETLAVRISEMAGMISFTFGMWTPLTGEQLYSKVSSNQTKDHVDTKVWKWCFLPVNIPTVWRAGFLGHTTHYRVSWYCFAWALFGVIFPAVMYNTQNIMILWLYHDTNTMLTY